MSRFTYVDAICQLSDYSKNQPYYMKRWEAEARFFSGAWKRQNLDAVSAVLQTHDPHGLREGKYYYGMNDQEQITELLTDLKIGLIKAGKPVNPHGALSRCIDAIQTGSKLAIINVYKLNKEIKDKDAVHEAGADKDLVADQDFTYMAAIKLLGQYSGYQPYYRNGWEAVTRFFSGAWHRNNVDAIETVLKSHDPFDLRKANQSEEVKIKTLLTDLNNKLITEGKEINPDGALAKTIHCIQTKINCKIIDIDNLNAEIKQNKFTF